MQDQLALSKQQKHWMQITTWQLLQLKALPPANFLKLFHLLQLLHQVQYLEIPTLRLQLPAVVRFQQFLLMLQVQVFVKLMQE